MYGELLKVTTPQKVLDKWDKRIAFIHEHIEYLSSREQVFLTSIEQQRSYYYTLNSKQVGRLYEIFHRIEWELG